MGSIKTYREVDVERAWNRVRGRLEEDGLVPDQNAVRRIMPVSRMASVAAALLALIAIGGLGYLFFSDPGSPELLTLQTGTGNHTLVQTFGDGSVVYMAGNSVLSYPAVFPKDHRKVALEGEAFFDIAQKSGQPFYIEAGNALVEVTGTAFNLKSDGNVFELIVEEGSVKVSMNDLPGYYEIVGEWEMLTGKAGKMEKSPVIDRTYLSWRMNRMQFRDEKLSNIAAVLDRNYNMQILFESDEIRERRLTVTFFENDIATIAEIIAFGLALDYEITEGPGILFRKKN